jgi:hypothetical protein
MPRPVEPSNGGFDELNLPVPLTANGFPLMMAHPGGAYAGHGFPAEPPKPAPWYLDFTGVVRRHKFMVLLAVLASISAGFYLGQQFKTNYWTIESRVRYVKQPVIDGKVSSYEPMSMAAYADSLTSEEMLQPVLAAFADRLPKGIDPIRYWQKELKVELPRVSDVIEIKVETADPQLAIDVINKLTEQFIEHANIMRRKTVVRHAADVLTHKIVDYDAAIARIQRIAKDYTDKIKEEVPIEKLDAAEIDSYHAQRRKSLLDLIAAERTRIQERKIELETKIAKLRRLERHYEQRIATQLEVIDAAAEVRTLQEQIKINEKQIQTLEENYRKVPVEYANSRIVELETQKLLAEQDLKLMQKKAAEAKERGISILDVDPGDHEWAKLRQRILGADSPEFEVIKPAAWPSSPSTSNRKLLTMVGAAAPLSIAFLLMSFYDHVRGHRPKNAGPVRSAHPPSTAPMSGPFRDESALLSVRIQQWIVGDRNTNQPGHPAERIVIDRDPEAPRRSDEHLAE